MKYVLYLSILFFLTFSACKEDVNEISPEMTAIVNGDLWEAQEVQAIWKNNRLVITDPSKDSIIITVTANVENLIAPSILPLSFSSPSFITCVENNTLPFLLREVASTNAQVSKGGGEIVLSEVNAEEKWISGSFHGECVLRNSIRYSITDGTFTRVPYTDMNDDLQRGYIEAMIDGQKWKSDEISFGPTSVSNYLGGKDDLKRNSISISFSLGLKDSTYTIQPPPVEIFTINPTYKINKQFFSPSDGYITFIKADDSEYAYEGEFAFAIKNDSMDVAIEEGYFFYE